MNDLTDVLLELKQKAQTRFMLYDSFEEEHTAARELWVRLKDVEEQLNRLKCEFLRRQVRAERLKEEEPENRSFWDGYVRAIKEMLGDSYERARKRLLGDRE